jgi:TrpR-related protein YerC/YecD
MTESSTFLFQVWRAVDSPETLDLFLEDWLTPREREELELRLDIARRLYLGQTYEAIQAETRASSTTISRVRRCLQYGPGGYRTVLSRVLGEREAPSSGV